MIVNDVKEIIEFPVSLFGAVIIHLSDIGAGLVEKLECLSQKISIL